MKNVLLVFGGVSYEHDISIVTAFQIYKKTKLDEVKLNLLYISRDGRFYLCNEKKLGLSDFSKSNFNGKNSGFKEVVFVSGEKKKIFSKTRFGLKEALNVEVAIFACHGGDGENGRLVAMFENFGIACSAGSSDALAVCMDKYLFKNVSKGLRIPVVAGFKINKSDLQLNKKQVSMRLARLGFPVIIKINSGGSSIGLFIAKNIDEFVQQTKEAFEFDEELIIEKYIDGTREFNIAVLGDLHHYEVSEIDEPIKKNEVLSFSDKYLNGGLNKGKCSKGAMDSGIRVEPVGISDENILKMKKIAKKIFVELGLRGVVRIDFLYDEKHDKIYVCEVNTIPGSLAYYFFKKNKIVTNDLVLKLVEIAEKSIQNRKVNREYMVDILSNK